ncbi:PKD domain-containing protein [Halodesulfurarchaeum sp. HSR-GB]|uniref:PKD domain-containing protein n=1 Tax=Halodesulfurarchaeum sp. HSR-GB TaxID=3074077 RepID=UPI00285BEF3C|nr:PKD domain-containing protein [Halodesulfurarchaeum sp. HSR-GB]MDR5655853.1 PKD domain-containing protein [Halodesulfurarchaeum sp. HSR-GB]
MTFPAGAFEEDEDPDTGDDGTDDDDTDDPDTGDDDADDEDEDDDTDEQPTTEEPTEPEPEVADSPDAIEELVPETVELPSDVEPTRAEVNEISPGSDGAGATVTFSEESTAQSITMSESVSGSATVVELESEPESTGDAPGQSVAVTQIEVPEAAADSSATIENSVPLDRIESIDAEPEELTVTRYNDEAGEWQTLETEVLEATDSAVRLEAETPGFSYFAVTAIDAPTAALDAPAEVEVGEEIVFDASESMDDDSEIVSYDWTVDGEAVEGAETLSHTFESAGEFTVELTVENDAGKTNTTSRQVVVLEQGTVTTTAVETTVGPETTTTETPGFTMGLALVALLGAALLVLRRSD